MVPFASGQTLVITLTLHILSSLSHGYDPEMIPIQWSKPSPSYITPTPQTVVVNLILVLGTTLTLVLDLILDLVITLTLTLLRFFQRPLNLISSIIPLDFTP